MSSSRSYLEFILEQLSGLSGVSWRAMMGEFILYYGGKVIGGIYDDRFLVKATPGAARLMPEALHELPYEGTKEMLLVDRIEDRAFMEQLLKTLYEELPEPKKRQAQSY